MKNITTQNLETLSEFIYLLNSGGKTIKINGEKMLMSEFEFILEYLNNLYLELENQ